MFCCMYVPSFIYPPAWFLYFFLLGFLFMTMLWESEFRNSLPFHIRDFNSQAFGFPCTWHCGVPGFLFSSVITEASTLSHVQRLPVSNITPNNLQGLSGPGKVLFCFCFPNSASHICVITTSGSVLN